MNEYCSQMYLSLQAELQRSGKQIPDFAKQIEHGFFLSATYWFTVSKKMASYRFPSVQEEIFFFKEMKPLFIAQMEYYNLLYHCELFKPFHSRQKLIAFLSREKQRLDRFIQSEASFYEYYKQGATHFDRGYFTRTPAINSEILSKTYNLDLGLISLKDHLVSEILALEKYIGFIQATLSTLEG